MTWFADAATRMHSIMQLYNGNFEYIFSKCLVRVLHGKLFKGLGSRLSTKRSITADSVDDNHI